MLTIHLNGSPGPLNAAAIGVHLALTEAGGYAGAASVLWELTTPPNSAAALDTVGPIGAFPWSNGFTPDVPGSYRVRLLVTSAGGSTEVATALAAVALPHMDGNIPAPLEETEAEAVRGWATKLNGMLRELHDRAGEARIVRVLNATGGALPKGAVVALTQPSRWPDLTGGVAVPGAPLDFVATAGTSAFGASLRSSLVGLALLLEDAADGASVRALRRGTVPFDVQGVFGATAAGWLYYAGLGVKPTWKVNGFRVPMPGRLLAATLGGPLETDDPPSVVVWDPVGVESLMAPRGTALILNNKTSEPVGPDILGVGWDLSWVAADGHAAIVRYSLSRGAGLPARKVGQLLITWTGFWCNVLDQSVTLGGSLDPQVTFTGTIANEGGTNIVRVRYTSVDTGDDGQMEWTLEEVW